MLDQLSDTDSVLDPKLSAKSVNVTGSIRHLSQEDLEAYANGRLASARLSYCSNHLDSCEACRAELEDIRNLQTELSAFARPETAMRVPERRRRRRSVALPLTASVAAILVVAVATTLWWRHAGPRVHQNPGAAPVAAAPVARSPAALAAQAQPAAPTQLVASAQRAAPAQPVTSTQRTTPTQPVTSAQRTAPPTQPVTSAQQPAPTHPAASAQRPAPSTAGIQTHDTPLAEEIAALPKDLQPAVSDAIQHGKLQLPADLHRSVYQPTPSSEPSDATKGFSLLGPYGEATSDTRPVLHWQPLAGAIGYSVAIADLSLRPVQHSPALRATAWRPRRPLARGRTYLWQVTATLHGGSKVVASSPSPSEALLRIIPLKLAAEIEHFRKEHQEAHLVLGVLYAQAGMLTEGSNELRKVPPGDSSYNISSRLLQSLSSGGREAGH
jgi:anti-sigma factor RsiW